MVPIFFAHPLGWLLFALLVVAVALAVWYTYQAAGALAAWAVGIGATVGLSAVLFVLMQYASRSRWGRGLVLDREEGEGDEERPAAVQVTRNAPHGATQQEKHRQLVGKTGVAQTHLRPAGAALIDGQRVDVVAEGERVDAGARVEVVAVEGNRVVVRRVTV